MPTASVITERSVSNLRAAETPPNSPTESSSQPTILLEVTQDLVDKLQLLVTFKTVLEGSSEVQITQIPVSEDPELEEARPRASRLEYKRVNEVYVLLTLNANQR